MKETFESYTEAAKGKVKNTASNTLVLAIFAGAFIAIAGVASTIGSYAVGNPSISKLISALIFPIGLILVVLFKTELFTGNSLLVIPLINKEIKVKDLIKNLIIVYIGNLLGAIIVALMLKSAGHYDNQAYLETVLKIANTKVSYDFLKAFMLGVLCNILVCMAVLISFSVKTSGTKALVIYLPIFLSSVFSPRKVIVIWSFIRFQCLSMAFTIILFSFALNSDSAISIHLAPLASIQILATDLR